MANNRLIAAGAAVLALVSATSAFAADVKAGALTVSAAWSRPVAMR